MSLRRICFTIVFLGLFSRSSLNAAEKELLYQLRYEGTKNVIQIQENPEFQTMMEVAEKNARTMDPSCKAEMISEILLNSAPGLENSADPDPKKVLSGYEVYVSCEETPSPAFGLYFDLSLNYLGSFDLAE